MAKKFCETAQICMGFAPVNLATAANTGDWVSLKNYHRVVFLFFAAAGTAGDDPTVTVQQGTSLSGGSAKALNFTRVWIKQGADLFAVGQYTVVDQSAANTYTDATSAEVQKLWAIEIDGKDLDVDGGFHFVQASVADIGTNSQIGCMLYILLDPRNAGESLASGLS